MVSGPLRSWMVPVRFCDVDWVMSSTLLWRTHRSPAPAKVGTVPAFASERRTRPGGAVDTAIRRSDGLSTTGSLAVELLRPVVPDLREDQSVSACQASRGERRTPARREGCVQRPCDREGGCEWEKRLESRLDDGA